MTVASTVGFCHGAQSPTLLAARDLTPPTTRTHNAMPGRSRLQAYTSVSASRRARDVHLRTLSPPHAERSTSFTGTHYRGNRFFAGPLLQCCVRRHGASPTSPSSAASLMQLVATVWPRQAFSSHNGGWRWAAAPRLLRLRSRGVFGAFRASRRPRSAGSMRMRGARRSAERACAHHVPRVGCFEGGIFHRPDCNVNCGVTKSDLARVAGRAKG